MENNNLPLNNSLLLAEYKDTNKNEFSFYNKPIKNTIPSKNVTLLDVYNSIISDEYLFNTDKYRKIKEDTIQKAFKVSNFDYVTFNGTFTSRADNNLIKASNYFIIDIDHLEDKTQILKNLIIQDKILNPQMVFISPSGNGLKIIVGINPQFIQNTNSKRMEIYWNAINKYFSLNYNEYIIPNDKNDFIDSSGKDISRACFLCTDKEAYLNINSSIIDIDFIERMNVFTLNIPKKSINKVVSPSTSINDLHKRHLLESENHHTQLIAFIGACKTIGIKKETTFNYINKNVNIANSSAHKDINKLKSEIDDIYTRYESIDYGAIELTPLSFGYDILLFNYNQKLKKYILTSIFHDNIRTKLHEVGFAKRKIGKDYIFIQQNGVIIKEVTSEIMKNYLTDYVTNLKDDFSFEYKGDEFNIPIQAVREIFFKNSHNIFNNTWLQHLNINEEMILKDTENEIYFVFKNCFVSVSKEAIKVESLESKEGFCIWEEQVINHDFEYKEDSINSHFYKFLNNVTNNDVKRLNTMFTGIGYLLHHYFRESEGQAVIFYDESITDLKTPMGGSGKGLIVNAIKQVRDVSKVDGKHLDSSNRFKWEQIKPSTQIAWLDDVKTDFDFSILHSNLSDGWTIERKHLSQFLIEPKDSPKCVICSNSIIKGGGTTNKRRQFIIELNDFYSKMIVKGDEKPIEQFHGCLFFSKKEWNVNEWNMFYSVMMDCALIYLKDCGNR